MAAYQENCVLRSLFAAGIGEKFACAKYKNKGFVSCKYKLEPVLVNNKYLFLIIMIY